MKPLPEETTWAFLSEELDLRIHDIEWKANIRYLDGNRVHPKSLVNTQPIPKFIDLYFS